MSLLISPLTYPTDTASVFAPLLSDPWSVFLDSGGGDRYDIIGFEPDVTLVTRAGRTSISSAEGSQVSDIDPLLLLRRELAVHSSVTSDLPFTGGALGFFAYDLGRTENGLARRRDSDPAPEMAVGIYTKVILVDHEERGAFYIGPEAGYLRVQKVMRKDRADSSNRLLITGNLVSSLDARTYADCFARIQTYLRAGDCYQVNLAQCFQAPSSGDAWAAYCTLRRLSPAPFGAYINLPDLAILCNSPERFLHVHNRQVTPRPIKGTRPRSDNARHDAELAAQLQSSVKDRAENLMIVDLLRNDLSKTCENVEVPELFSLESYATVHHLVSTVTGHLRNENDCIDLLRGCLPGGSVTGAPKRRAMEIIDELEPVGRGIYCGAIGYIGFNGNMDTNIAIRTMVNDESGLRFWAGGGIVADSLCDAEYEECLTKASALMRTVMPMREDAAKLAK